MTSNQATWNWTKEHMKKSISRETLLVYSKFSIPFLIHAHASKVKLVSGFSQDDTSIPSYSRKLNPA